MSTHTFAHTHCVFLHRVFAEKALCVCWRAVADVSRAPVLSQVPVCVDAVGSASLIHHPSRIVFSYRAVPLCLKIRPSLREGKVNCWSAGCKVAGAAKRKKEKKSNRTCTRRSVWTLGFDALHAVGDAIPCGATQRWLLVFQYHRSTLPLGDLLTARFFSCHFVAAPKFFLPQTSPHFSNPHTTNNNNNNKIFSPHTVTIISKSSPSTAFYLFVLKSARSSFASCSLFIFLLPLYRTLLSALFLWICLCEVLSSSSSKTKF